jgi:hypothetical protein
MVVKQYRQISIRQHSNFPTYTQLLQIPGKCRGPFLGLAEFMPRVRGSKPIAIIFFSSIFLHWFISHVPCYSTNGRIPLVHITRTMLFNQWPYFIGSYHSYHDAIQPMAVFHWFIGHDEHTTVGHGVTYLLNGP